MTQSTPMYWLSLAGAWSWRPLLLLLIAGLAVLYLRGSRDSGQRRHPARFWLSLAVLAFALTSPLDRLTGIFLFARVAQHLLVISLFPALFMASDPLPTLLAGLPKRWGPTITSSLAAHRSWLTRMTPKGICWFIFVAFVWLWYDPRLLNATNRYPIVYDLSLVTMIGGALLHWWHVNGANPRLHGRLPGITHVGYTLAGAAPLKIPGLFFLIAGVPIYDFPPASLLGLSIDPLLSQQMAGILIWILGGTVYSTTAFSFFSTWVGVEAKKPSQPRSTWDNEERFIAPHLE